MDFAHLKSVVQHKINTHEISQKDGTDILACLEIAEASPLSKAFKKPDFKPVTDELRDDNMAINHHPIAEPHNINL